MARLGAASSGGKDCRAGDSSSLDEEELKFPDLPHVAELPQSSKPKPRFKGRYNIISRLFLFWVEPLLWLGCQRTLEQSDLYEQPSEADSEKLLKKFNGYWAAELQRKRRGKTPRLLYAVVRCFWLQLLLHGAMMFSELSCQVGQSVLLGYLAESFNEIEVINSTCAADCNATTSADITPVDTTTRNAYLVAAGIGFLAFLIMILHGHTYLRAYKLGMMSRIILTGAIYQKVLSLSQVIVGQVSIGHIVNLASNDVQRFDLAFIFCHILWIAPIHLCVVTYLVYLEVGWCAFLMTVFVLLQLPLQIVLARAFARLRFKSARLTDKRVRIMNEVITGIRVIKMYAWEHAFKKVVMHLRKRESFLILSAGLVRAASLAFMIMFLTIAMYIIFVAYASTGGELTPKNVFTTLSILIIVRWTTVHFLIQNTLAMVEGRVASRRLQELLELDELGSQKDLKFQGEAFVASRSMSASWSYDSTKLVLKNVNFSVFKDQRLMAVVGPVGAGKSTLIQCFLKELTPVKGGVEVNGRVSYSSQDPWVFSATLKENILFGKPYDEKWYQEVVRACALDKDIERLVNGDLTLVGERGVTLSGGQKARVNLARAVYHDADIYLLDDPLSAVDAEVGKHIFEECICGLLKDRLVILVTHQVHFALQADQILVLKDGHVEACGSQADLLAKGLDPQQIVGLISASKEDSKLDEYVFKDDEEQPKILQSLSTPLLGNKKKKTLISFLDENHTKPSPSQLRKRVLHSPEALPGRQPDTSILDTASLYSSPSMLSLHFEEGEEVDSQPSSTSTLKDKIEERRISVVIPEEKEQGTISSKTYYNYFRAGGSALFILTVFAFLFSGEIGIVLSDWWLADWASCSVNPLNQSTCSLDTIQRIWIYTGTNGATVIIAFARTLAFYYLCVNASRVLHNRMFKVMLRVPVLFFDTNPIGRVLNRFSKDIGFLDDLLPYVFTEYLLLSLRSLAIIATALATNWWSVLPAGLLLVGLLMIRWYFLKTAREVKRLEALVVLCNLFLLEASRNVSGSEYPLFQRQFPQTDKECRGEKKDWRQLFWFCFNVARSPVYSHISATLQGLPTIRSFGKQHVATQHFHNFQNEHTQGWYLYLVTTRWLGLRVDTLSCLFILSVSFISVGLLAYVSDRSLIGLSLTYIISLSGMFQYVVRQSAEVENLMISSERVMEYGRLEPEGSLETQLPYQKPPEDWPQEGKLNLEDVAFRYSPELPLVLKNLSFSVRASEKVGIVGRTGAGKSSLLSVLYRLAEPYGQVTIDGVETKSIGLHDLRKKMSIIPQDPVLFSGSMRYNLDPFEEYSDAELWEVLEQVQLKAAVEELEGQLSGEVSEGGSNFSVGQRQLVCLARALLRKNKILILDEATANVDPKTDEIIQATIRSNFSDTTVLTIAHRLNTIMDSDRILVMSDGQAVEFDTPLSLLQNRKSVFFSLVEKTGAEASRRLYQMAVEADNAARNNIYDSDCPKNSVLYVTQV